MKPNQQYKVGQWLVELDLNLISSNGNQVQLEPKAADVLRQMIQCSGQLVSRDELVQEVWHGRPVSDEAINRVVARLRKALGDNAQSPKYIETIPTRGYRLKAQVEVVRENTQQPSRLWLGFVVLLVSLLGLFIYHAQEQAQSLAPSLQITPLTVLSGNERHPAFSPDGQLLAFAHRPKGAIAWQIAVQDLASQQTALMPVDEYWQKVPKWSPDGQQLIFQRWWEGYCGIHVVDFDREQFAFSASKELIRCNDKSSFIGLSWDQVGEQIFYTDGPDEQSPMAVWSFDLRSGEKLQLTQPTLGRGDYDMALSDDGKKLALVRTDDWYHSQIVVLDLETNIVSVVKHLNQIVYGITWTQDHRALLIGSLDGKLTKYGITDGHEIVLYQSNEALSFPEAHHESGQLVVTQGLHFSEEIWLTELNATDRVTANSFITSSRRDWAPEFAHHSRRLAFISDRTGSAQIWIRQEDKSLRRITNFEQPVSLNWLRWSPDDKKLLYVIKGAVWAVDVDSGTHHQLAIGPHQALIASWSFDGGQIYFSSQDDSQYQIWQFDFKSGETTLLIDQDAYVIQAGNDEKGLFFSRYRGEGLWYRDLNTGLDKQVLPGLKPDQWNDWRVIGQAVYFSDIDEFGNDLYRFDLNTGQSEKVLEQHKTIFSFSVSGDESVIATDRLQNRESSIIHIDGF